MRGSRLDPAEEVAIPLSLTRDTDPQPLVNALADDDVATALDLVLDAVPPDHWAVDAMLGAIAKPALSRQPVGPGLLDHVTRAWAANVAG
jgi:hypothetical protein